MRTQERLPRRGALRHWRHAARLQNARDRRATNPMPEVLQRALDPGVAPPWILLGHPDDEPLNLREHAAPARPSGVRPFPSDELPMPPENRIGRDDRGDLTELTTAHSVSVYGQSTAFLIGQADPVTEVRPENPVLFDQIGHRLPSPVGPPAGHGHHDQSKRGDIHNRGSLHDRRHITPHVRPSAERWDISGVLAAARTVHIARTGFNRKAVRGGGSCCLKNLLQPLRCLPLEMSRGPRPRPRPDRFMSRARATR